MEVIFDTVSYHDNYELICLDELDATLFSHRIYGVVGKPDSGKNDFMELLSGLKRPTAGEIHYDEMVMKPHSSKATQFKIKTKIGHVPRTTENFFSNDTVYEEIESAIKLYHYREDQLINRIYDALKMVGLPREYESRNPETLSSGEQKLLALALALVHNPTLLVLEEPIAGLDYHYQEVLIMLLRKLKNRFHKTIVINSNNMDFMIKIVDDVLLFHDHRLLKCGSKYQVFRDTRELKKIEIESPSMIAFSDLVLKKKNIKIGYRDQINDLIKDIYRYAEWGCEKHDKK